MPNIETNVLPSVRQEHARSLLVRTAGHTIVQVGVWAGDTAHKFAALLADLMAPAVFLAYAITAWSLATSLAWSSSFLFSSGPLSNWLVWLGFAILLNFATAILKRRTQSL